VRRLARSATVAANVIGGVYFCVAMATLLVSAANVVAVLAFIVANAVRWPETLVMLAGAVIGGYGGARIGRWAPPGIIRTITLFATSCITLAFFVKTYAPTLLHR